MPRDEVLKLSTPQQIKDRFAVSLEAATLRYKEVIEKSQPRSLTKSGISFLAQRKAISREETKVSAYIPIRRKSKEDLVWDAGTIAINHDPSQYRYSRRGILVQRSEYLKQSHFGWFIVGNQICAHRETNAGAKGDDDICPECGNLTLRHTGIEFQCTNCGLRAQL